MEKSSGAIRSSHGRRCDESPNSARNAREKSTDPPRSLERELVNVVGRRKPPAESPMVRSGCPPLGSRVREKLDDTLKRGRSHEKRFGVIENRVPRARAFSNPRPAPRNRRPDW